MVKKQKKLNVKKGNDKVKAKFSLWLSKLRILVYLVSAVTMLYFGMAVTFNSLLTNIVLIVVGLFVLIQATDRIDQVNHLGQYNDEQPNNQNNNDDNNKDS